MKKLVFTLAAVTAMAFTSCGDKNADKATTTTEQEVAVEQGDKYALNLEESVITWKVGHKGGLNPRFGTLKLESGDIAIDDSGLNAGNYIVSMNTIAVDPTSVDSEEDLGKLEGHLKSADFFGVETYPTVKFVITGVEDFNPATGASVVEGANKRFSGNLTILDKTVNISFPAKVEVLENKATMEAKFVANRTDWGLKFGTTDKEGVALNPAEWGISQDMEIGVSLVADKK